MAIANLATVNAMHFSGSHAETVAYRAPVDMLARPDGSKEGKPPATQAAGRTDHAEPQAAGPDRHPPSYPGDRAIRWNAHTRARAPRPESTSRSQVDTVKP